MLGLTPIQHLKIARFRFHLRRSPEVLGGRLVGFGMPSRPNRLINHRSELPERIEQMGKWLFSECLSPFLLRFVDDLTRNAIDLPASFCSSNQDGSTISRIGNPLDVSALLQYVDDLSHRLLGDSDALGQFRQTAAFGPTPLKDGLIRRAIIRKAALC